MLQALAKRRFTYRTGRILQICTVLTVTLCVADLLRYPHSGWTGFAVMMIYAGFDNGTTLFRAYHRFIGVLLGLLSGYCLWFLGHIDYRCLILVIPITVFLAYFLAGYAYSIPTIFTVNTSIIGTGYFDIHNQYPVTFFLMDYFIATLVAFAIIIVFEHFWFKRYHMMYRFIHDTQVDTIKQLDHLIYLLEQDHVRRKEWFSGCLKLTECLFEANKLVQNTSFEVRSQKVVGSDFHQFIALANQLFISAKALYLAHHTQCYRKYNYVQLKTNLDADLRTLRQLIRRHPLKPPVEIMHETIY